jgi:hypothetical protein
MDDVRCLSDVISNLGLSAAMKAPSAIVSQLPAVIRAAAECREERIITARVKRPKILLIAAHSEG